MTTLRPRLGLAFGIVACTLSLLGCTDSHPSDSDAPFTPDAPREDASFVIDAGPLDGGEPDAPTDAGTDVPVVAFDEIYTSILVPRCGHCHVDEDPSANHYTPRMTDVDTAYTALIDVPVLTPWVEFCVPDGVTPDRVRPNDLEASMLAFLPDCYVRDADHDALTEDELATVRGWIAAGAPRSRF